MTHMLGRFVRGTRLHDDGDHLLTARVCFLLGMVVRGGVDTRSAVQGRSDNLPSALLRLKSRVRSPNAINDVIIVAENFSMY